MLETALAVAVAVVVGAVAALKLIAPKTKTQVDDRILARLEQVLGLVPGSLKDLPEPPKPVEEPIAPEDVGKPNI